ncbi:MAG TPA: hypothetical protein VMV18_12335, partial [bacterium]|nr:hypothetical protein [bacterium]
SGFTDAALDWLVAEPADGNRLRNLLRRLKHPDFARLPELVAAELKDRQSSGFGSIPVHNLLLQEQLDALLKLVPALIQTDAFVYAYLTKLQPGPDVDWQNNPADREAFLTRVWDFVKPLSPRFNPLKAHVLYHRLDHDRRQGKLDAARFQEYLKLPRAVSYANGDYLKQFNSGDLRPFNLGQDFRNVTLQSEVSDDEALVRDLLSQIFVQARDFKPYDSWISDRFLKEVFATTKMLAGVGDMEQWFSMINDAAFCQALKERVEIGFAYTNRNWFRAADPVTLEVDVKNVATLTVKVFEINALNYFLANNRDVDTAIDLDGLVASEEQTQSYSDAPMRRVRRTFQFPSLAKPGVYIVEMIGGGISSRALVRKGRLRFLERVGAAGHVFTVLDEDRNILKEASLWLGGREYKAEADGSINVPFSNRPGRQTILLRSGSLTTLEAFDHQAESYSLAASLYVDRESLIKKKEAKLVVRASLQANGVPTSLKLLEDPILVVQSTDRDGVSASQEVHDFPLSDDKETVHVFQVPEKLASLSFTLKGKVQNLSQGKKVDLADSSSVSLNGIDADAYIEDLHLARTADGYVVYLLGKSGEAKPGVALNFSLRHRDLAPQLDFTLQTDAQGRVELGHLRDVVSVSVNTPAGISETWAMARDRFRPTVAIHVRAGEPFRVPWMDVTPLGGKNFPDAFGKPAAREGKIERTDVALLERLGPTFVREHFSALARKDGYLEVAGLPAGNYDLLYKRDGTLLTIRVVPGEDRGAWIAGEKRQAERRNPRPVQIRDIAEEAKEIVITVGNASERTRVHVFGTRFVPAFSSYDAFCRAWVPTARAMEVFKGISNYVSGRDIGDEYRYILERKQAKAFAGNMLARPGLLLNPWAVRGTETATQDAKGGDEYAAAPPPSMSAPMAERARREAAAQEAGVFANLDFLTNASAVLPNLKPDEKGVVRIPRDAVAHANLVRVVAVDPANTVSRDLLLPEVKTAHEDLRLKLALDAEKHFSEKKQITVLSAGQPLEIADIVTAKTEVYDTLGRVYRLYSTLSGDANLATFAFVQRWPKLSEEEKRAKYSEFACHELSFFLSRKDPDFFAKVIKPYLRNKMHKTFMDHYLLGDDLAPYRKPWAFGRLNIVERILLSQRIDDEGEPIARHARDLNDLLPRDIERANFLFGSAIQGSALEAGDALGIAAHAQQAERAAISELKEEAFGDLSAATMSMGAGMAAGGPMPVMAAKASMAPPAPRRAAGKMKKQASRDDDMDLAMADESPAEMEMAPGGADDYRSGESDRVARGRMRQFYQKLDKTQEWAENNYWHLLVEQQGPELITINPFWRDFANHRKAGPFLSTNIAYASRNFAEMMLALGVLDLPFEAEKPTVTFEGARMRLTGKSVTVAWHKEIKPVEPAAEHVPILVSQNYFRDDDRSVYENDEQIDKYVTGEFLINVVYTCQVVLTNPTSSNQKLDLLLQIPAGAIPVRNGFVTNGRHIELSSYATESLEYAFYFPAPGTFAHFPVHVAKNEQLIAAAAPTKLQVVRELSTVDKTSWAWLSQNGKDEEVLAWMEKNNVDRLAAPDNDGNVGLELIAWRMREKKFYEKCIALLTRRHIWNNTLWAYSVHHGDVPNIREFLQHQDSFLDTCGPWLESPLVTIDAVVRNRYQHLEYAPLVNARTQKLGAVRTILNDRFSQQYTAMMSALRYRKDLSHP